MTHILNPYINFKDNAKEAMTFYQSVLGGKLNMSTFAESGAPEKTNPNGIMHSQLTTDNGMTIMASDTPEEMEFKPGTNIQLSLSGDDEEVLKGYWEKLSSNGNILLPLEKAPWGDMFGMLVDQFGIRWLVNITTKKN